MNIVIVLAFLGGAMHATAMESRELQPYKKAKIEEGPSQRFEPPSLTYLALKVVAQKEVDVEYIPDNLRQGLSFFQQHRSKSKGQIALEYLTSGLTQFAQDCVFDVKDAKELFEEIGWEERLLCFVRENENLRKFILDLLTRKCDKKDESESNRDDYYVERELYAVLQTSDDEQVNAHVEALIPDSNWSCLNDDWNFFEKNKGNISSIINKLDLVTSQKCAKFKKELCMLLLFHIIYIGGNDNDVVALLDRGVNIEKEIEDYHIDKHYALDVTPLALAVEMDRVSIVKLLLKKGAQIRAAGSPKSNKYEDRLRWMCGNPFSLASHAAKGYKIFRRLVKFNEQHPEQKKYVVDALMNKMLEFMMEENAMDLVSELSERTLLLLEKGYVPTDLAEMKKGMGRSKIKELHSQRLLPESTKKLLLKFIK